MPATATYKQEGCSLDHTPVADVTGGDVVVQGEIIGIAKTDIGANKLGALATEGVFAFAKSTAVGSAIAKGQRVYWDAANSQATWNSAFGVNKFLGKAFAAAADADATVSVRVSADATLVQSLRFNQVAASAAVTNTTAETAFDQTYQFPVNALKAGDLVKVRAQVIATATNATDTLTLKLKIGNTVVVATAAVDVANNDIGYIEAIIAIRTDGAGGTLVACGVQALGTPGTVTAKPFNLASTAVDTTAAQTVSVTATWSVANAGNSCRLDMLAVELVSKS